jgi:FkbM family methyltransferase
LGTSHTRASLDLSAVKPHLSDDAEPRGAGHDWGLCAQLLQCAHSDAHRRQTPTTLLKSRLLQLLSQNSLTLTLVDIGASLEPFPPFKALLPYSNYVAFDPDLREITHRTDARRHNSILINEAVIDKEGRSHVRFFLTRNPTCSSTLRPNQKELAHYLYAHRFEVVDIVEAPAISLNKAMETAHLNRIDWLKLDTQGTDLRLLTSIDDDLSNSLMAVDAEPGFDQYYEGEDTFPDFHSEMLKRGFWLSDLTLMLGTRLSTQAFTTIFGKKSRFVSYFYEFSLKGSPIAAGPRYLRTIESLQESARPRDDYVRLWACSFFSKNFPYALEVIAACEEQHGTNPLTVELKRATRARNISYAWRSSWRLASKLRWRNAVRFVSKPY